MDSVNLVDFARTLIDIDSTTGHEARAGAVLAASLRQRGWRVTEQAVADDRVNVLAVRDPPRVVFSTHYDCVPPFFPSRVQDGRLYGRGSCDAKGILAAQVAAADGLAAAGETRVGLLFVVGEERGSDGARAAAALAGGSRYLVNGEPTDNRLGLATKGAARFTLRASGRAAHSAYPERGESAIEKLIDALVALRGIAWPEDPELGRTTCSVGLVAGGVAPNVVPPEASAEVMFRTVGPVEEVRRCLSAVEPLVSVSAGLEVPPVRLATAPGFETAVFAYTTDIPFLASWGTPLLLGPGSIHVAHTDHEHVAIDELIESARLYQRLACHLLTA